MRNHHRPTIIAHPTLRLQWHQRIRSGRNSPRNMDVTPSNGALMKSEPLALPVVSTHTHSFSQKSPQPLPTKFQADKSPQNRISRPSQPPLRAASVTSRTGGLTIISGPMTFVGARMRSGGDSNGTLSCASA